MFNSEKSLIVADKYLKELTESEINNFTAKSPNAKEIQGTPVS